MTKSVPPDDPMSLMRLKLDHADARLNTLQRQLERWAKRHPVVVVNKLDFQSGWYTSYLGKVETLPARFAIPIGESLYHGRSVLDHLVWALVKANKQTPGKDHGFPILPDVGGRRKGERRKGAFMRTLGGGKLVGVDRDAMAVIERLQPYNRRKRPPYFLTLLNEMARDDRHHALHVARTAMADPRNLDDLGIPTPRGVTILECEPLFKARDRLKAGAKLARFRLSRYGREPKVGIEADLPVLIAVGKRRLPLGAFYEINEHLRKLLGLFEEFL